MITYFNLRAPDSEGLIADDESYGNSESRPCPITSQHIDGSRRIGPISVRVKHNYRDEQMIWCWAFGTLLHERLLADLEQLGFTGYRTQPATVCFRDGSVATDYREFIVTGWAGIARPESGVTVQKSCSACQWKHYSAITSYEKLIDWTQWSGEDFFMVWPIPHKVLITERVAQWFLGHDIKSFRLTGLDDWDHPAGSNGFTVGRLSDYLPEDLAIKYGKPLGLE
jgi:hypothetical protein